VIGPQEAPDGRQGSVCRTQSRLNVFTNASAMPLLSGAFDRRHEVQGRGNLKDMMVNEDRASRGEPLYLA
jgi:hypothetical protein